MLDPAELECLQREKTYFHYQPSQLVYGSGRPCEALYCVASGTVVDEQEGSRREPRRVQLLEAGDPLGWSDFFGAGVHRTRATCLTDATICGVPAEAVRGLIGRNPLLGLKFLGQATRLREPEHSGIADSRATAGDRLSSILRSLARQSGSRVATGETRVALALSRRNLADLIAVSPVSLSSAIRDLELAGRAHFYGRTVWINDPDRLPLDTGRDGESAA